MSSTSTESLSASATHSHANTSDIQCIPVDVQTRLLELAKLQREINAEIRKFVNDKGQPAAQSWAVKIAELRSFNQRYSAQIEMLERMTHQGYTKTIACSECTDKECSRHQKLVWGARVMSGLRDIVSTEM